MCTKNEMRKLYYNCAINYNPRNKTKLRDTRSNISCLFCSQSHFLDGCQQFAKNKHCEKISFVKDKGVCFGCLNTRHLSKHYK